MKVSRQGQVELANEGELGLGPEPGVGGDEAVSPLTHDHPDVLHYVGVKPVGELLAHALVHRAVHLKQKTPDQMVRQEGFRNLNSLNLRR